jgi:acetyl esterase/lipase
MMSTLSKTRIRSVAGAVAGLLAALFAAGVCGCARVRAAQAQRRASLLLEVRRDITYFEGPAAEAERHRLDLYLPAHRKGFPFLLFIHGGAWRMGSKDIYRDLGRTFASRGIGVAVANYRLSPGVKHPEHVRDVARAFAWLARHAKEFGGDEKRLFVAGHSAGGHLVALLALDPRYLKEQGLSPDAICGVVGISGPYALAQGLFPEVFGDDPARRSDAFPLKHVGDHPRPFLLLYADHDYPGLPAVAKMLDAALRRHGGRATLKEVTDRDHITIVAKIGSPEDPVTAAIVDFVNAATPR